MVAKNDENAEHANFGKLCDYDQSCERRGIINRLQKGEFLFVAKNKCQKIKRKAIFSS